MSLLLSLVSGSPSSNPDTAQVSVDLGYRSKLQNGSFTVVAGLVLTTLAATVTVVHRVPTVQQLRPISVQQPQVTVNTLPFAEVVAEPNKPTVFYNPYSLARAQHDVGSKSLALTETTQASPRIAQEQSVRAVSAAYAHDVGRQSLATTVLQAALVAQIQGNPTYLIPFGHDVGRGSLALTETVVADPFLPKLLPNPERPQVRQYDTNGKANGLVLDAPVIKTVHRGPTYQPLRTRQVQQPQYIANTVINSVAVVAPTAPTAGGYYPADPRKRKKLIIDGKTYIVSPQEEAQLVQAHIDRLNEDKREAEKEVKGQQKLLRIAISTAPKNTEQKPAQVRRVETRIAEIMESLIIIEAKRREAKEIKAMLELANDEEEAMALILSMGI